MDLDKGKLPSVQKFGVLWKRRKTCSSSESIHHEMCTDVTPTKAQFPEKKNNIFRAFGISDAIYHSCKGFVPRNLDHGQRLVSSRFSCNKKRGLFGDSTMN